MLRRSAFIIPIFLLMGCDSDGDGLSNKDEKEIGSDPEIADTDGDGINDGDEVALGTSPIDTDSDGDGYDDNHEVDEGSDPTDADDGIYAGGWPYQPDKDGFDGPDIGDVSFSDVEVGAKFARLQLMDQYGDLVDNYDFAGQGVPVVIDISAVWCGPCNGLADWIAGGDDAYGFGTYWENVQANIEDGKAHWLTVLSEDLYGDLPDSTVLEGWAEDYPDDKVPVMADTDNFDVAETYLQSGWPTAYLLDENMEIIAMPTSANHWEALDAVNEL